VIEGYIENNGKLDPIIRTNSEQDAGAGGIYATAADMSKWILMQLNGGKYGSGLTQQLFTQRSQDMMWTPEIFLPVSTSDYYQSHFGAYGLGWFLNDARGYKIVSHTGQDDGMISEVLLIPELHTGITVLTNRDGGGAVRAVIDQLSDYFLGVKGIDRIAYRKSRVDANQSANSAAANPISKSKRWQTNPTQQDE